MILVRTVFQARFGKAGEYAEAMKSNLAAMARGSGRRWRILTDLSGQFDTVVMEFEVASLADWERERAGMFQSAEFREMFGRTAPLVESGRTEFYTIEGQG